MAFELNETKVTETATVDLLHPVTGQPVGASITVYGQDSDVYRSEVRKYEDRIVEYAKRNRGKVMPAEMRDELALDRLVACVESIDGLTENGEPFTDAARLFTKYPWVREQVEAGVAERANFIKGSSEK